MDKFENIQNLIKEAKTIDSTTFEIDQEFRESLRERLYQHYLNNFSKGGSIMAKLRTITLNWKVALVSFMAISLVALVAGGGVLLLTRGDSVNQEEILLAANLAVADGKVEIRRNGSESWAEALAGETLHEGDSVKTGEGEARAVLELDNGDAIRLNAESEVRLESMDPKAVIVEQVSGESYNRVATSEENTYTVKSQGVEAQALGTAYKFDTDKENKQVGVYVYESKVKLNIGDEKVSELKKAIIDTEKGEVDVSEMSEEEFNEEFAQWGREKDKEAGVQCNEENGPTVTITEPADRSTIEPDQTTITVKGTVSDLESALKKIVVNGAIYWAVDGLNENGKGFALSEDDPTKGSFEVDVAAKESDNAISIRAYDVYWNKGAEAVITVTRKTSPAPEPDPVPTNYFYVSSASSPKDGKIYVEWAINGYSAPKGFKVVAAIGHMPVYPGDKYTYVSESGARSAYITSLPAGTYNVRVCIYTGSGCSAYTTNYKVVVVGGGSESGNYNVNLSWTSDGCSTEYPTNISLSASNPVASLGSNFAIHSGDVTTKNGYKVCYAEHSNPTYPTDSCTYIGGSTSSHIITGLKSGHTYHFRVGAYKEEGGGCQMYSNNVTKTMP
jgi:hypothetical protein